MSEVPRRRSMRRLFHALGLAVLALALEFLLVQLWAEYHFRAAHRALEKCRFAEAREHLQSSLKVRPWSAATHLLAAQAARRDGAFDEAAHYLQEAERLGTAPADVDLERAMLRCQRGELREVEHYLRAYADSNHPQTPLILEALASGYTRCSRIDEANDCFYRLLELQPNHVSALLWRACKLEAKSVVAALDDYRRVLKMDPENEEGRLRLALALFAVAESEEAAQHFEFLRLRRPKDPEILLGLARCRIALEEPKQGRLLIEAVLADDPSHFEALLERGKLATEEGDCQGAERWLQRALAVRPNDRQANHALYICLNNLGRDDEARALLPKLRKIERDIQRLAALADMEGVLEPVDVERALSRLHRIPEEACEESATDAAVYYEIGRTSLGNGQEKMGVYFLERAVEFNPKYRAAHKALAQYYEHIGDLSRAERHRVLAKPE